VAVIFVADLSLLVSYFNGSTSSRTWKPPTAALSTRPRRCFNRGIADAEFAATSSKANKLAELSEKEILR
jgi:hypothetical protein